MYIVKQRLYDYVSYKLHALRAEEKAIRTIRMSAAFVNKLNVFVADRLSTLFDDYLLSNNATTVDSLEVAVTTIIGTHKRCLAHVDIP